MRFEAMRKPRELARRFLTLLSVVAPIRPLIGPVRVTLEVSNRCNYTCLMCPHHSPLAGKPAPTGMDLMDVRVAERAFAGAARIGAEIATLSGKGEPLMHPRLGRVVRMARDHGLRTEVFTNGSLLTQRRIEELIDSGLDRLGVSLVSPSPAGYVKYHPGVSPGTFQRVLDSLTLLQLLKRKAGSRTPILDLRFIAVEGSDLEVDKMVDLCIRLGADNLGVVPLRNRSVGEISSLAPSVDREEQVVARLRQLAPMAAKARLKTNLGEMVAYHAYGWAGERLPCYAGWLDTRVLVDGTVEFCMKCRWKLDNVKDRPLDEIWRDDRYRMLRTLARDPVARVREGACDCDRCCHFYANYSTARRLASLRLGPGIEELIDGVRAESPRSKCAEQGAAGLGGLSADYADERG